MAENRESRTADGAVALLDDPAQVGPVRDEILQFVERTVANADADGVVVNMSGGLDSTLTATLAVDALGADAVYGLVLPCNKMADTHAHDAEEIASVLGIEYAVIHLRQALDLLLDLAPADLDTRDPVVRGNLTSRLRMSLAYLVANATQRLVVGTTNRSELLLGYFTKYGDGAADFLPLGDLYKTEVEALARSLDLPEFIIEKPSTAGFWVGQTDEEDIGASYRVIDEVLRLLETGADVETVRARVDADAETITTIRNHFESTRHKRRYPPTAGATERSPPAE